MLFKLDELVRPFVHKILVVIEPLLIDEDYYARVEGREIIANLSKAAGLATMIAAMRPDIDNVDEYVRGRGVVAFFACIAGGLCRLHRARAHACAFALCCMRYGTAFLRFQARRRTQLHVRSRVARAPTHTPPPTDRTPLLGTCATRRRARFRSSRRRSASRRCCRS